MKHCPDEFVAFAHTLADAAGEVHRRWFRNSPKVEIKADESLVTQCDKETEQVLRGLIDRTYPQHGVIGEEFPATRREAEFVWVFDPVDGTQDFVCGKPVFGTLIALSHGDKPVLGLIDQAIVRDRWVGANGHGASLNGKPARPRACARIADALVSTSGPGDYAKEVDAELARVRKGALGSGCYGRIEHVSCIRGDGGCEDDRAGR